MTTIEEDIPIQTSDRLVEELRQSFTRHVHDSLGKDAYSAIPWDLYEAVALTTRDRLVEQWLKTICVVCPRQLNPPTLQSTDRVEFRNVYIRCEH